MPVIAASSAEAGRCQQRFLAVLLRRVVGIRCQFSPKLGPLQPLFFFFTLLYFRLSFLPCLFVIANLPIREIDDYPTGRSRGLPRVGPVQVSLPFDRLTRHYADKSSSDMSWVAGRAGRRHRGGGAGQCAGESAKRA